LKFEYKDIIENQNNSNPDFYIEKMKGFEKEYKRQKLLAEIRPDHKEIITNLDHADIKLSKITPEDYKEITKDMRPSQIALIENERYNQTKAKEIEFVR